MDNNIKISENILKLIDTFIKKDSKEAYYGTGTKLHFSEIYMVKFIKENDGLHIIKEAVYKKGKVEG